MFKSNRVILAIAALSLAACSNAAVNEFEKPISLKCTQNGITVFDGEIIAAARANAGYVYKTKDGKEIYPGTASFCTFS
jgi:hypothetical protein